MTRWSFLGGGTYRPNTGGGTALPPRNVRVQMAHRALVRFPDGRTVEEADVTPLSARVVHAGEIAGWAVLTFAALYVLAHIVTAVVR